MRTVLALFDAPLPARAALAALRAVGVDDDDIAIVPDPAAQESGTGASAAAVAATAGLFDGLKERGVPEDEARAYAEGVARGAILVLAVCATGRAGAAVAALRGVGAVDLDTFRAAWARAPDTHYAWRRVPPPDLRP